jgi:hypothetical protein
MTMVSAGAGRSMSRRHGIAVIVGCLAIAGCGRSSPPPRSKTEQERKDEAKVHTELAPLRKIWPQLGDVQQAHWINGPLREEDDRQITVPGPVDYFFEAVLVMAPADVSRLTSQYHFTPATIQPVPPKSLTPFASDGPWVTSPAADSALTASSHWYSELYLRTESRLVYLSARKS